MAYLEKFLPIPLLLITGLIFMAIFLDACEESAPSVVSEFRPIKTSEIIAFQKAYGVSFNAISKAIEEERYYESTARKHIKQHYNFDEGKVMFKIGNEEAAPFRYTFDGLLSYLIGKNKEFPMDKGIANQNWRKIDWHNNGIITEGNVAIVIGKVKMVNEDNNEVTQNYTMGLKRNSRGDLKLVTHKISPSCE